MYVLNYHSFCTKFGKSAGQCKSARRIGAFGWDLLQFLGEAEGEFDAGDEAGEFVFTAEGPEPTTVSGFSLCPASPCLVQIWRKSSKTVFCDIAIYIEIC